MESIIKLLKRPIQFENHDISLEELFAAAQEGSTVTIVLPAQKKAEPKLSSVVASVLPVSTLLRVGSTYIIQVREYMTKKGNAEFDFHRRYNNDVPMPFRIMEGTVLEETRGMVKMSCLVVPLQTSICSRCGRALTNPISMLYGIGPECGNHAYINPFSSEEELNEHLEEVRAKLATITWTGWIIKSSIEKVKEVL